MSTELTSAHTLMIEGIASLAKKLNDGASERNQAASFDRSAWEACGALLLPGISIPKEKGGMGVNSLITAIALEAFGKHCIDNGLGFSIGAHLLACVLPIWKYGSDDLHATYLKGLCNGEFIAANAMTESASGSDAFTMETTATPAENGYRLNGRKVFVSNAPIADLFLVYAATDQTKGFFGGITAFLVQSEWSGVSCIRTQEKNGLKTCPMGEMEFNNVLVPLDHVVGKPGGGGPIFTFSMVWERIQLSALHLGVMSRIVDQSIRWAKELNTVENQAIAHTVANMKIALETTRQMVYYASSCLDQQKDCSMEASICKTYTSESYATIANDAFGIASKIGPKETEEALQFILDASGSKVYSGTNEIQRNIISGKLGL